MDEFSDRSSILLVSTIKKHVMAKRHGVFFCGVDFGENRALSVKPKGLTILRVVISHLSDNHNYHQIFLLVPEVQNQLHISYLFLFL